MVSRVRLHLIPLLSCLAVITAAAQIPPDEIQKIDQAIPAGAVQKPAQPRKLLVFTRSEGFQHDAIPYAARMLELMGKKTGAFEAVTGDDMALFKPESLRRFDAVLFDNTTQLKFEDPALRKALLDFVKSGKGLAGIHAATDNFPTWPEGQEMIGGTFDNHPWTAEGTWKVALEDPAHPLMASFNGQGFSIRDEIYRIKPANLRARYRVLMGLDMKDEHNRGAAGVRNSDKDLPISWIGTFGKGRIFYCSLGHNKEVYWNPAVVRHYLAGIQYALGDLQADATPLPFNSASFFDQNLLDRLLKDVSSYTYGQSREPLQDLDAFVRYVSDISGAHTKLEQQFLALLRSGATLAGKQFICSRLGHIGTGASVPTLAGMLADSTTREMAMYALEFLPGDAVNDSLCRALSSARGRMRCGIINALGRRHAAGAVDLIQPYLTSGEEEAAISAAGALAEIGQPAADALAGARKVTRGAVLLRVLDASVRCAEKFARDGDTARALPIYKELQVKGQPVPVRLAALRGTVLLQPESAAALIIPALQDTSLRIRATAAQLVREVPGVEGVRDIAGRIGSLPSSSQVQLLAALDDRHDPEVFRAMVKATKSPQVEVRAAALRALVRSANYAAVPIFADFAVRGSAADRAIARDGLATLKGSSGKDSVLAAIVGQLQGGDPRMKTEMLGALAARRASSAVPVILQEAASAKPMVGAAAAKALRTLARPEDLSALARLLVKAKDEQERKEWEATVVAVARKEGDPSRKVDPILSEYNTAKGKQARISLLTVLGKVPAPGSLDALKKALNDRDADVQLTAIRGLSGWPTPDPANDLWEAAQHGTRATHRAVALRGFVRLLGLESARPADETIALYRRALTLPPNPEERKRLLSSMADAQVPTALRVAADYFNDPQMRTEAEFVTVRIAENIMGAYQSDVVPPLTRVAEQSENRTAAQRAKELLALIQQSGDFLTTWEYAGPYTKAGSPLFSTAFPPEEGEAGSVQWKLFPAGTNSQKPWLLDLGKVVGGEARVVYLRNRVWSDSSRKAVFEIGSDDGIKFWLNGALVHSYDVERLVNPGDDQVEVTLQQGWNNLLLKIDQRVGEWGACVKLRAPREASKLQGIRVARVTE